MLSDFIGEAKMGALKFLGATSLVAATLIPPAAQAIANASIAPSTDGGRDSYAAQLLRPGTPGQDSKSIDANPEGNGSPLRQNRARDLDSAIEVRQDALDTAREARTDLKKGIEILKDVHTKDGVTGVNLDTLLRPEN